MIERTVEFAAPIEKCFQVLRNFEAYPQFLKGTLAAKEKGKGNEVRVDFQIDVIKTVHYTLKFRLREPEEIVWELVEGEMMKKNSGAWKLERITDQLTRAHYKLDIQFGWLVPQTIVNQLTKLQLPEMLNSFKEQIEMKAKIA